jgi:hypothetical protein
MEEVAIFKRTDRLESYQLVMRTERIHGAGLHLTLHKIWLSDCPLRHQIDPVEQRIVLKFPFLKRLG